MEDILTQLTKDASPAKYIVVKKAAQDALDLLHDKSFSDNAQAYQLRERCLLPLQLALESKNTKLTSLGISGIQRLLSDGRFHSSLESEKEDSWLPMQVLQAVSATPVLNEDTQVEVMKVLLNMTFTTSWCMNAKVINKITELCICTYLSTDRLGLRNALVSVLSRILGVFYQRQVVSHQDLDLGVSDSAQVCVDTYGNNGQSSVRTAVRATLTQLLTAVADKIPSTMETKVVNKEEEDVLADFSTKEPDSNHAAFVDDVVNILQHMCNKLVSLQGPNQPKQVEPLLLEGIHAILDNAPPVIAENQEFVDLLWKQLCPTIISLLGNPKNEKSITTQRVESQDTMGRGAGCSVAPSSVQSCAAKTIYNIAVQLVRLVGSLRSMRPVLESLFHRILLYPPPSHRHEAIKALKEVLCTPERVYALAGPTQCEAEDKSTTGSSRKRLNSDVALLKLIIDCLQECCHSNDSAVCITAVHLVNSLLASLEQMCEGAGLSDKQVQTILQQYTEVNSMDPDVLYSQLSSPTHSSTQTFSELNQSEPTASHTESQNTSTTHKDMHNHKPASSDSDQDMVKKPSTRGNQVTSKYEAAERKSAQRFVAHLKRFLPVWLECASHLEVDEVVIEFASKFCSEEMSYSSEEDNRLVFLNGDGVYVATYSALLLNLKLLRCAYYHSEEKSLPISQQEFVDEILGCGLLLYLSPAWLSELYGLIIEQNLLEEAGYKATDDLDSVALIQVLTDIDGLDSRKSGGQLLHVFRDNHNDKPVSGGTRQAAKAGMRLAEQILLACWDGSLDVLSILLNGKSSCGISSSLGLMLGTEGAKEESMRARQAVCTSLEGLQKAARLACVLGLHERAGAVFAQLANASCIVDDFQKSPLLDRKFTKNAAPPKPKPVRVHAAHALSLDLVLGVGLEMASHAQDCWQHVLRCCSHIAELEHAYFSSNSSTGDVPKVQTQPQDQTTELLSPDDAGDGDLYAPLTIPAEPVAPSINVAELIRQGNVKSDWDAARTGGEVLPAVQTPQVLCGLSQQVDRFYEDAANKLNMKSLVGFLTELCKSSQSQLAQYKSTNHIVTDSEQNKMTKNAVHLYRLGDVLLKCLHGGRPLMHIMRAWSAVTPHLVEAACHKDHEISKQAVQCIHECVTTLLSSHQELPYFYFNEALCKPFENLLCLELCDGDIQDQVVCSVCELVEGCAVEIKSGWRPLFGALRAVKLELTASEEVNEARQRHITAVLDVFEVFLNTDNVWVFANAAVDCILCLLKYVKGPAEFAVAIEDEDYDSDSSCDFSDGPSPEDLCIPALNYLRKCCLILGSMWNMPACPIFQGAGRIKLTDQPKHVDPNIPGMDFDTFSKLYCKGTQKEQNDKAVEKTPDTETSGSTCQENTALSPQGGLHFVKLDEDTGPDTKSIDSGIGVVPNRDSSPGSEGSEGLLRHGRKSVDQGRPQGNSTREVLKDPGIAKAPMLRQSSTGMVSHLEDLDNHTGILHVWFLVLDGLANIVATCPKNYQPQTMEVLFDLLRTTAQTPGPEFSIHCVNHLVLPMMQHWLRSGNQTAGYWEKSAANFKQCAGLCTDLVVEYITLFGNVEEHGERVQLMLQQLLDVLIECVAQTTEAISRLGCACIRHCFLSAGPLLTESLWYTCASAMERAFSITLYSLRQLMTPFQSNSDNFYGDVGQVKVAVRKDCSSIECERLRQLAHQVFLLDSQHDTSGPVIDYEQEEDRSYIFLLYPPDQEDGVIDNPTRVPFRAIVVGLLSHHLLLQTLGCLLLQGSSHMMSSHAGVTAPADQQNEIQDTAQAMPGMLKHMSCRVTLKFLQCLWNSHQMALDFDLRPGLKFLVQKVIRASVAANLYKQACAGLTFYVHTLLEICSHQHKVSIDYTKQLLVQACETGSSRKSSEGESAGETHSPADGKIQDECVSVLKKEEEIVKMAERTTGDLYSQPEAFMLRLQQAFDHICVEYVDMFLEREGPSIADRLAEGNLVFLIAQPEEIPLLKRDRDIKDIVAEKLKEMNKKSTDTEEENVVETELSPEKGETSDEEKEKNDETSDSSGDSPRKLKNTDHDKVYTVATDHTIRSLMSQYKKRKQQHTLPTFVRATRSKPLPVRNKRPLSSDPVDHEIDRQQRDSLMKDSEAHLKSWIDLICTTLNLLQQLSDQQFQALLPPSFHCLNQLMCYCRDTKLREALAHWLHRVATIYDFAPVGSQPPKAREDD